jgi:monofunctional biosynthetic peptidoglycan transglycosylase
MRQRLKLNGFPSALTLFFIFVPGLFAWSVVSFYRSEFPDTGILKKQYPVVRYQGPDEPFDVELVKSRPSSWVPLSEISKPAVGAIVVSEDWAFFQHKGYDLNQITEAIKKDLKRGKFARGASTITQQVVRNVFLEQDKNIWRKVKELYLATQIEKKLNKKKILEIYLNIAEWGQGVFGIGPAAHLYFGKAPAQLTAKEGAFLAMLLPSPKRYSSSFRSHQLTKYAHGTVRAILRKMVQAHYLSEDQYAVQLAHRLSFETVGVGSKSVEVIDPEEPSVDDEDTNSAGDGGGGNGDERAGRNGSDSGGDGAGHIGAGTGQGAVRTDERSAVREGSPTDLKAEVVLPSEATDASALDRQDQDVNPNGDEGRSLEPGR